MKSSFRAAGLLLLLLCAVVVVSKQGVRGQQATVHSVVEPGAEGEVAEALVRGWGLGSSLHFASVAGEVLASKRIGVVGVWCLSSEFA